MVKNIKYSFLFYFLISIFFVGLSQQKKIEQKKEELFDIKKEIRLLENQYKQKSKKEKTKVDEIEEEIRKIVNYVNLFGYLSLGYTNYEAG